MEEKKFGSRRHSYTLATVFFLLLLILGYRLFELQFVEYEIFRAQAEKNSVRRFSRDPLRGMIYDRDMNVLIDNNPSYTLTITPFEFKWESLPFLDRFFGIDTNLVRYRILQAGKNSFEPVKIARDLSFVMLSLLEENRTLLTGVNYLVESRREYQMRAKMSHLFGYTKEISPFLLKKLGEDYRPGDVVGFNGIESFYESHLRGRKGYGYITVNSRGKVIESFEHGRSDIPASEGADLILSLDMDLQVFAENLMNNKRGAIVALDPNNGEILAYISSPDYDLSELSGRIPIDVWKRLNSDPGLPLFDRCSMAAYPPGSTYKMLLALAALQEGIIDENSVIECPGSFTLAGVTFKCHGAHGNVNVTRAIEHSCNVFFYKLIFKLGFASWSYYGNLFHFGRRTGVDISNENPGILPSEEYYNKRYGKRWNKGFLVSLGIGQGEINTTPLQMASYTAAIANGGTYYRPHAVRAMIDRNTGKKRNVELVSEKLPLSPHVWKTVQHAMYRVVNGSGTGYAARVSGAQVAGKTGTAQNPHGIDHAWFVGYAPYVSPKIAIAVIIENGGFGGEAAAPIAGAVIRQYLYGGYIPSKSKDSISTLPQEIESIQKRPLDMED